MGKNCTRIYKFNCSKPLVRYSLIFLYIHIDKWSNSKIAHKDRGKALRGTSPRTGKSHYWVFVGICSLSHNGNDIKKDPSNQDLCTGLEKCCTRNHRCLHWGYSQLGRFHYSGIDKTGVPNSQEGRMDKRLGKHNYNCFDSIFEASCKSLSEGRGISKFHSARFEEECIYQL